jgi:hypothetical protein
MTRTQQIILNDLELRLRERIIHALSEFKERCDDAEISDTPSSLSVLTIFSYFLTTFAVKVIGVEPVMVARLVLDAAKLMAKHRDQEESAND